MNESSLVYLLHQRPYRESSVIADCLSENRGRFSVVCKGVRGSGRRANELRSTLQPFALLDLACYGRGQLKNLRSVQVRHPAPRFAGRQWFAALYLNELLVRVAGREEDCGELFHEYRRAILGFQQRVDDEDSHVEIILREFELALLQLTGFELDFSYAAGSSEPINEQASYQFVAGEGFRRTTTLPASAKAGDTNAIQGSLLRQIGERQWQQPGVRQAAKRILREALLPHLGGGELQSRRLYREARSNRVPGR